MIFIWHGLNAQQFQSQAVQAVEDAEQVRLVYYLSGEDRPPVFALHEHPLAGGGKPFAKLATHHYAVVLACALLTDQSSSLDLCRSLSICLITTSGLFSCRREKVSRPSESARAPLCPLHTKRRC